MDEVELEFEEDALGLIAEKALEQKTGARGLRGVIEGILTPIMFSVPSEDDVEKVIITRECANGESKPTLVRRKSEQAEENISAKKTPAKKSIAKKTAKKTDA